MDARLRRQLIYGLLLLFVLGIVKKGVAQPALNIGVAANFAPAMEQIGKAFTQKTSIPVRLTISSSGRLFAQIHSRAPFDLFFSADALRPELLHKEGLCAEPVRYATGRTVLWSGDEKLCALGDWKDVVTSSAVRKIAMANPETAPYGTAAREACSQLAAWPDIEKKLVFGTNVGQAFQYARTGLAQAAFVALSLALSDNGAAGCFREVGESPPVVQKACVTTYSPYRETAERFLRYAASQETASLLEQFGYM